MKVSKAGLPVKVSKAGRLVALACWGRSCGSRTGYGIRMNDPSKQVDALLACALAIAWVLWLCPAWGPRLYQAYHPSRTHSRDEKVMFMAGALLHDVERKFRGVSRLPLSVM